MGQSSERTQGPAAEGPLVTSVSPEKARRLVETERELLGVEVDARQRFGRDTAEHAMTVLRDDGLYRHLRFQKPGSSFYYFDLVTWPGNLVICGDMGAWHFARIRDMFEFFGGYTYGINPDYWAEKLQTRRPDAARVYSHDALRTRVLEWGREHCEWEDEVYPSLMAGALEREILWDWTYSEHEGRERLDELEATVGYMDCWEWDLCEYDAGFLWCCWAIVRGIERYRQASDTAALPASSGS